MKTTPFEGEMENAHSKKLTELRVKNADGTPGEFNTVAKFKYAATFEAFENLAEVKAANEFPSDTEIVDAVNNKRKAAARQKAMTAVLDANNILKPDVKNDIVLRLRKMADLFEANGSTPEEARAEAAAALKLEWPADSK